MPRSRLYDRLRACLVLLLTCPVLGSGADFDPGSESPADPYAQEPYWYRPGHPLDPAEASNLSVPTGFVAERLFTVPRELGSWTALTVDPDGRLITAAQHEPGLYRLTPPDPNQPDAATKVERLAGEAAKIGWSQGLLHAFDSLYVTVAEENDQGLSQGLYRLQDTNGDGEYDQTTLLFALEGSGEHGPHNLVPGPDGESLYLMCGNGTRLISPLDRRRPTTTTGVDHLMAPGFAPSEHSTQGWVLRFAPDGTRRELICSGLRNTFDLAFNCDGELFGFDSDGEWDLGTPWYRPTRVVHLVSGGEYGWRNDTAIWADHCEDMVAPVLNIGPGSPTGLVFGYGSRFPTRYQDALFACDWTFATIHAVFLERAGGSYTARVEEFVGGVGLPVTDAVISPDGAMYVIVGGRRLGSAVYRIRYVGTESTEPPRRAEPPSPLQQRRRQLEHFHGRVDPAAVAAVWPYLGQADRAVRFAARVALEAQPIDRWRERALAERHLETRLTAFLALARQGDDSDLEVTTRSLDEAVDWETLDAEQKLRVLRILELTLARSELRVAPLTAQLRDAMAEHFPDSDRRVTWELARVLGALGETRLIDRQLAWMAADRGATPTQGLSYFTRNPKYGQAVRDMLSAAPLTDRMHHAQMLLWSAGHWSPEQRELYFTLVGDALTHSRGGHSYREFWSRIRDAALERCPESEREALAALAEPPPSLDAGFDGPGPLGPGREWTVAEAITLAASGLSGRDLERGRALYHAVGCATCHRLGESGGSLGPDLSGLGQRFTMRDVIEAIIEPSRAVSDQYRMVLFQLTDGNTVSGRVLSRDERATHVATNLLRPAQTTALVNTSIRSEEPVALSTMPEGLVNTLNEQELLDLLAYVVSGGDPDHSALKPPAVDGPSSN